MFYYIYTQNFVIINNRKIVDPKIDFNDHKILSNFGINYIFQ